ncbi:GGDEF domain-containing protein [Pseudomonas jilinensis]|uniref:GGDEF domain-containing protein n=2 Tax=Pseudomonas jilinensis TaxID=2078689 RepID=A0A396S6E0_9PSED|nr:GGDEF domain-containing protein [Pseudomonas jilinensis]
MSSIDSHAEWPRVLQAPQEAWRLATSLLWLFVLFALPVLNLQAQAMEPAPLVVDGSESRIDLKAHIRYLRDSENLDHSQALTQLEHFRSITERRDINFGYTRDTVWLALSLSSQAQHSTDWVLELSYPSLDQIHFYSYGPDGLETQLAGDVPRYAERDFPHRTPIFKLRLEPGEQRLVLLQVRSEGSMTLDGSLWQAEAFRLQSNTNYVILAIYFGMLLALGGYNLLLFLVLRERSFLLYVLFVFSFAAGAMAINGLGPHYLWPNSGELGNRILPVSIILAATIALLFAQAFLNTAQWAPRWHQVLTIAATLAASITLLNLVVPVQTALQLMSMAGLLVSALLFACGLSCMLQRVPGAGIFVLAWLMLLIGASMLALRNFGLIPSNFVTVYAMQVGSALEMLLLSLGLAARFNELKRQKELAQSSALAAQKQVVKALQQQERVLEQRVAERTQALEAANARLAELAMQDPLTRLANRSALANHLHQALQRTQRHKELLALVLIDLNDFKAINDQLGHESGDQVLCQVAQRLKDCAREADLIARLGGDEFILVSEGIQDQEDALRLGERLEEALSLPIDIEHGQINVGASIGISLSDGHWPDAETLMRYADQAMYQRKRSGRSGIQLYADATLSNQSAAEKADVKAR